MNRKLAILILALAGGALTLFLVWQKAGASTPVKVTLRFAVTPEDQTAFVMTQARAAKFKYEAGKQAGLKPALAQKLALAPVPHSAMVDLELGVETEEEGRRYVEAFLEMLQARCGPQAQIDLVRQSIR